MVNQANIMIVVLLGLTLLGKSLRRQVSINPVRVTVDRVLCFLYSLLLDNNNDIDPQSIKSFFYFELPFWYLNMATVIQFFEW